MAVKEDKKAEASGLAMFVGTCDVMRDSCVLMEMPHFVQSQSAAAATAMMHHPTSSHSRSYKRPAGERKASLPPSPAHDNPDTCRLPQNFRAHSEPRGRIALASHDAASRCHAETPKVPSRSGGFDDTTQTTRIAGLLSRQSSVPPLESKPVQAV